MKSTFRITPLDSLRGLAAIGVAFFWHYQHFQPQNGYPFSYIGYWFYHYGWNLVDFFFVLSGFIFSYVYKEGISSSTVTVKEYIVLRVSRLYPLHFITLIIVLIFQTLRTKFGYEYFVYQFNDLYHFTLNALFAQGGGFGKGWSFNAPTWSVSSEIVTYLLFFYTSKYLLKKSYILSYIIFIVLGLIIVLNKFDYPVLNEKIGRVLIGFFIGCIAYEINLLFNRCKSKPVAIFSASIVFLGTIFYLISIGQQLNSWPLLYTIIIYPLAIILILNVNIFYRIFSIKLLAYLGDISYSIYLWHFPIQLIIKTLDDLLFIHINFSSSQIFILFVLLTIFISILSYEFIEKPISKIIRKKFLTKTKINCDNKIKETF